MKLVIQEKPQAKARHRLGRHGNVFDPQTEKKNVDKWNFKAQMLNKGISRLSKQPIMVSLVTTLGMPRSWTEEAKNANRGRPCISQTGDVDNYCKYYLDVLNGIAYEDDSHISHLWGEKTYADEDSVEINLTPMGGDMIQEHAKTIHGEIDLSDLEYMVMKAHRDELH